VCVGDRLSAVLVVSSGVGSHRAVWLLTKAVGLLLFQCAVDKMERPEHCCSDRFTPRFKSVVKRAPASMEAGASCPSTRSREWVRATAREEGYSSERNTASGVDVRVGGIQGCEFQPFGIAFAFANGRHDLGSHRGAQRSAAVVVWQSLIAPSGV
jgi:hypothetical protein